MIRSCIMLSEIGVRKYISTEVGFEGDARPVLRGRTRLNLGAVSPRHVVIETLFKPLSIFATRRFNNKDFTVNVRQLGPYITQGA